MKTLREVLAQAEHDSVAIRHFNVSDLVAVRASTPIYYKDWGTGRNVLARLASELRCLGWPDALPRAERLLRVQVGRAHEMWFD